MFIILTGHEAAHLWVADGSHKSLNYPEKTKHLIAKYKSMKLITIRANYTSVVHCYLKYADADWSGTLSIWYHIYPIPDVHLLKYAVPFAYERSLKKEGETTSSSIEDHNHGGKRGEQVSGGSARPIESVYLQGGWKEAQEHL